MARSVSKACWVALAVAMGASATRAAVVPIAVSGYNHDIVVEAGAPTSATGVTTASMDGGSGNSGFTWYEQGYNAGAPTTGVPLHGTTIVSANASDHSYTLPASYGPGNGSAGTTNDAFAVGQGTGSATMTLTTPALYSTLSLLGAAGHGPNTVSYTINHADTSTETGTISVLDWFGGTAGYTTNGRVAVGSGSFDSVNSGNPRLYSFDITLTNTTSPVTSVALASGSTTSTAAFFSLSGQPVPEPGTIGILGVAATGLLARRRRA